MRNKTRLLLILFFSCWIAGCAPVYVPTTHNVPLFSGKGEFQSSLSVGPGINAQAAYSISNHVGISLNYLYVQRSESDNGRKHQAAEFGLGYYTNMNERWCFEVFTGYGFGKGSAYDSAYSFLPVFSNDQYEGNGTYNKLFIQPSIGFRKGSVTFFVSGKVSYVDFTTIKLVRSDEELKVNQKSTTYFSLAHSVRVPVLSDKVFFQYQGGFNVPIGKDPVYDFDTLFGSIGFIFMVKPSKRE